MVNGSGFGWSVRLDLALKDAEKERLLGVTMAAYQIETLHLCLGIIDTYPKDVLPQDVLIQVLTPLFKLVLGQQRSIAITTADCRAVQAIMNVHRPRVLTPTFEP